MSDTVRENSRGRKRRETAKHNTALDHSLTHSLTHSLKAKYGSKDVKKLRILSITLANSDSVLLLLLLLLVVVVVISIV